MTSESNATGEIKKITEVLEDLGDDNASDTDEEEANTEIKSKIP